MNQIIDNLSIKLDIEKLFNWRDICQVPLSETFIDDNSEYLDWDIVSSNQFLPLWLVKKYEENVNFYNLSYNKLTPPETIKAYIDKMFLFASQRYNVYTEDMILNWACDLDINAIVIYQKISVKTLKNLLQPFIEKSQWVNVRSILDDACIGQTLNEEFYDDIIHLENTINFENNDNLFSRKLILEYQKSLKEQWVLDKIVKNDEALMKHALYNFPLTDITVLTQIVNNKDHIDYKKILKVQKLSEHLLYYILELNKDNAMEYCKTISKYQKYDLLFIQKISKQYFNNNPEEKKLLYNNLFIRTLSVKDANYLHWYENTIVKYVLPELDLNYLSKYKFNDKLPRIIEYFNVYNKYFVNISYYNFILCNSRCLTTDNIIQLRPHLNCIEFWFVLKNCNLSKSYIKENKKYLKWWDHMKTSDVESFIKKCTDGSDLKRMMLYFIYKTNWMDFLKREILPEWFIEILSNFKYEIEKHLKNVSFWSKIVYHQTLSIEFINTHINDIGLKNIVAYQYINQNLYNKWKEFFDDDLYTIIKKNQPHLIL